MSFETNVFVNCPFDAEYEQLLKPLVFTLLYLGLEPQICVTTSSAQSRIEKIKELIKNSKYSIHDISRCEPLKKDELPRFNMPYEMGLDIGCQSFGQNELKQKKCLILEKDSHRYDVVISDISGQDIKHHNNDPEILVDKVREWFLAIFDHIPPSGSMVWIKYLECSSDIEVKLISQNYNEAERKRLSHLEFRKFAKQWIALQPESAIAMGK